jgi:hypothetical protein
MLDMNDPRYLLADLFAPDLPGVALALQDLPLRWQWLAAVFFSKDLTAVCRKVALRESCPT